jgi:type II secretion system protein G
MLKIRKGFTLIELLVVLAIIALLSTLAVVSLNNAREKSRDSKRVSDMKQVQTALELYFSDQGKYPVAATAVVIGASGQETLSSTNGWATTAAGTTYMARSPKNPTPGGADYSYTSADGSTYALTFTLEGASGGLATGAHTASPSGIQ